MATRKILYMISLALLINPALHCMEDPEISEGGITLITAQKSIGSYEFFTKKNPTLTTYGIVKSSTDKKALHALHEQASKEHIQAGHMRIIKKYSIDLIKYCLGQGETDSKSYDKELRNSYVKYMKNKKIEGIFAFLLPPGTEDKEETGKIFVVNSDEKQYKALWFRDDYKHFEIGQIGPYVGDQSKIEGVINRGRFGSAFSHIVLVTDNVSKDSLMEELNKNTLLHAMMMQNKELLSGIKACNIPEEEKDKLRSSFLSNAQEGLKTYQNGIIHDVFQQYNPGCDEVAVLLIPLHDSYVMKFQDLHCDPIEDKKANENNKKLEFLFDASDFKIQISFLEST